MPSTPADGFFHAPGWPLLGSLVPLSRNALGLFTRLLTRHGDRIRLRVPGREIVLLAHPDDIEQVLVRDRDAFGRSAELRKLRPIFGDGLLASEGALWRRQRTLIQPSFAHSALTRYTEIMLSTLESQLAAWRPGDLRDLHAESMRYTRDTICAVLFGDDFTTRFPAAGPAVSVVFGDLRSEVLYLPFWRRLPTARPRRWNRAVAALNHAVRETIALRRASAEDRDDLLGALLRARDSDGNAMSSAQVHDEILTFFLAGHETAALALTWAVYLLALHPEAQTRIRDEVRALTGESRPLTPADLPHLRWTGAVVREAMRLYPPVWSMGREATAATTLAGEPIRPGIDIWICTHRLHRDPRWFADPDAFQPERWLDQPAPKPFTYLPFGIGPRVCIGQHFATAEVTLGLALMASRFGLHLTDTRPVCPSAWITLRPARPISLRLSPPT